MVILGSGVMQLCGWILHVNKKPLSNVSSNCSYSKQYELYKLVMVNQQGTVEGKQFLMLHKQLHP